MDDSAAHQVRFLRVEVAQVGPTDWLVLSTDTPWDPTAGVMLRFRDDHHAAVDALNAVHGVVEAFWESLDRG